MNNAKVGAAVRARRELLGLSLRELARIVGCSHVHLWDVEQGRRGMTPRLAGALAKALGISADELDRLCERVPPDVQEALRQYPEETWAAVRAIAAKHAA